MVAKKWQNPIQNLEPHKCKDLTFFDINSLPNNTIPYVAEGIKCSLEGVKFIEFGWD